MVLAFTLLALLTAGLMVIAAFRVLPARRTAASTALGLFFVAAMLWCMAYIAEISSGTTERMIWGSVKFVAIQAVGPTWLAHALIYRRADGRTPWLPVLASSAPNLIVPVLLAAPHTAHLVRVYSEETGRVHTGPIFWYNMAYQMALILTASILALRALQQNQFTARRVTRLWVLAFTVCLPVVGNIVHVFKFIPNLYVDPTPMLVCAASPLMLWAMAPAGANMQAYITDEIVRAYPYPTVLVDASGRVESLSAAAEGIFGDRLAAAGMPVADLLPGYPLLAPSGPIPATPAQAEVSLCDRASLRRWQVDRSAIRNANDQVVAHLYVFGAVPSSTAATANTAPSHADRAQDQPAPLQRSHVIDPHLSADAVTLHWPTPGAPAWWGFCQVVPVTDTKWLLLSGSCELADAEEFVQELLTAAVALARRGCGAAQITSELNLFVHNDETKPHTQALVGVCETTAQRLHLDYSLAGMEPLVTIGAAGAQMDLATPGPAWGTVTGIEYSSYHADLDHRTVLVSTGLPVGYQGLAESVPVLAATTPQGTTSKADIARAVGDLVTAAGATAGPVLVLTPAALLRAQAEVR